MGAFETVWTEFETFLQRIFNPWNYSKIWLVYWVNLCSLCETLLLKKILWVEHYNLATSVRHLFFFQLYVTDFAGTCRSAEACINNFFSFGTCLNLYKKDNTKVMNYSIREDTRFEYCRYGSLTVLFVGATKYSVRKIFLFVLCRRERCVAGQTKSKYICLLSRDAWDDTIIYLTWI